MISPYVANSGSDDEDVVGMIPLSDYHKRNMRRPKWTRIYELHVPRPGGAPFDHPWCGFCMMRVRAECDLQCGSGTWPHWCGFCEPRRSEWCSRLCRNARLLHFWHNLRFIVHIGHNVCECYLPCSWCADEAITGCETCGLDFGPPSVLCNLCDDVMKTCRLCMGVHYVKGLGRPRPPYDATRLALRRSLRSCIVCGLGGITTKCGGCRLMPYCSIACQHLDWPNHKVICKTMRGPVAVMWIYPWQTPRVDACRAWSMRGLDRQSRFAACFGSLEPF